jgi:hypothetical protein
MVREAGQEQRTCQAAWKQLKLPQLNGQTTTEDRMFFELLEGLRLSLSSSPSNFLQLWRIATFHSRFSSQQKMKQAHQPK